MVKRQFRDTRVCEHCSLGDPEVGTWEVPGEGQGSQGQPRRVLSVIPSSWEGIGKPLGSINTENTKTAHQVLELGEKRSLCDLPELLA